MRTWKQIESSRETRMWITQIGIPVVAGVALFFSDESRREWAKKKVEDVKNKTNELFKKVFKKKG